MVIRGTGTLFVKKFLVTSCVHDTHARAPDLLALAKNASSVWEDLRAQNLHQLGLLSRSRIRDVMADEDRAETRNSKGVEIKGGGEI